MSELTKICYKCLKEIQFKLINGVPDGVKIGYYWMCWKCFKESESDE